MGGRFGGAADDEATGMDLMFGADGAANHIYVVGTFGQTASFATPAARVDKHRRGPHRGICVSCRGPRKHTKLALVSATADVGLVHSERYRLNG